jgi:hypothetical protein
MWATKPGQPFFISGQALLWALPVLWLLLNLWQAAHTELDPDEAYYWMYSHALDWGYFDHPPAVALSIRLGTVCLAGELGVRLGTALLQLGSFFFIWLLAGKPREKRALLTLALLLAAMPMLQVYGFIATPDGPLLFFSVLFFYLYQRFLSQASWANSLLLGTCMAALLYSKYHGVLLILFTLFSNLRLLRQPRFYLASVFGALLFMPHLYWQYSHDFPSFAYHLKGRDDPYELKFTLTYLINQVVIFSPLLFPLIVQALWRRSASTPLERAFRFVVYGFWLFFFYATFKGHAEPQWTAILSIPFVLLLYRESMENERFGLWARRLAAATILLLLAVRLELATNWIGLPHNLNHRQWIAELRERAEGKPVLFQNSYRDASKYAFYAEEPAYTFTDVDYRRNQFDIWEEEAALHDQSVLIAGRLTWKCAACEKVALSRKRYKLQVADSLQAAQKVRVDILALPSGPWAGDKRVELPVRLYNPYPHAVRFGKGNLPLQLGAVFYQDAVARSIPVVSLAKPGLLLPATDSLDVAVYFTVPDSLAGSYQFGLGPRWGDLPPLLNSQLFEVEVD